MKIRKLVCGVGINDADYVVQKFETIRDINGKRKRRLVWECPFYRTWCGMLRRCYSIKLHEEYPTYIGCSVSEEWKRFRNFKSWMEKQDWEGKHLDKDLLFEGNKVYSEDTCAFVLKMVNTFTTDCAASRGEWLIGVCWNKGRNKFMSSCRNPLTNIREHLGYFDSEQEAHQEWLKRKLELAKELAEIQTDQRVAEALVNRYKNYKPKPYSALGEVLKLKQ